MLRLKYVELILKLLFNILQSPEAIPNKNLAGEDISAKKKKNIADAWAKQLTANEKLQAELAKNTHFLQKMQAEIDQLKQEIAAKT